MKKLVAASALLAGLALAGCAVPTVGQVTPPPIAKTAPESPLITQTCRAELAGIKGGADLANVADVDLGYWVAQGSPADEVQNTLDAFRYAAQKMGAADCG